MLMQELKALEKEHPDWTLDIIGDGEEKEKLENLRKKQKSGN